MADSKTDYYSKPGAALLADRIILYWQRRGFAGVTATRYQDPNFAGLWFVRSNIGARGFPPRRPAKGLVRL